MATNFFQPVETEAPRRPLTLCKENACPCAKFSASDRGSRSGEAETGGGHLNGAETGEGSQQGSLAYGIWRIGRLRPPVSGP